MARNLTPEVGVPVSGKRKNAPPCDLSDPRSKMQLNHLELELSSHGGANSSILANSPIITVFIF